jgi:glycerophosphoryl diester phosphodiesterase
LKKPGKSRLVKFSAGILAAVAVLGLLEVFMSFGPLDGNIEPPDAGSLDAHSVIAHALGGIDGVRYSNSLEAFNSNYANGYRTFEVDLMLTADRKVVAVHDGLEEEYGLDRPVSELTAERFKEKKYRGKYTPLGMEDIISLLHRHPDVVLVTDVKSDFETIFRVIVREIRDRDPALMKRIVPQIYREQDYFTLKQLQEFEKIIFTLYKVPSTSRIKLINYVTGRRIARFISGKEDIVAVTMSRLRFMKSGWLVKRLRAMDRDILVHTLNDEREIARYVGLGATGIYTDDFTGWGRK